jgi:hypothetical protein
MPLNPYFFGERNIPSFLVIILYFLTRESPLLVLKVLASLPAARLHLDPVGGYSPVKSTGTL